MYIVFMYIFDKKKSFSGTRAEPALAAAGTWSGMVRQPGRADGRNQSGDIPPLRNSMKNKNRTVIEVYSIKQEIAMPA